jgi:hypothetical protein
VQLGLYFTFIAPIAWMSYRYIEFGSVKNWRDLLPSPVAIAHQEASRAFNSPAP